MAKTPSTRVRGSNITLSFDQLLELIRTIQSPTPKPTPRPIHPLTAEPLTSRSLNSHEGVEMDLDRRLGPSNEPPPAVRHLGRRAATDEERERMKELKKVMSGEVNDLMEDSAAGGE